MTPSGVKARRKSMNAHATAASQSTTSFGAIVLAAVIGLGILVVTGHVQAATLHDAAHDVRHATGFPCH